MPSVMRVIPSHTRLGNKYRTKMTQFALVSIMTRIQFMSQHYDIKNIMSLHLILWNWVIMQTLCKSGLYLRPLNTTFDGSVSRYIVHLVFEKCALNGEQKNVFALSKWRKTHIEPSRDCWSLCLTLFWNKPFLDLNAH